MPEDQENAVTVESTPEVAQEEPQKPSTKRAKVTKKETTQGIEGEVKKKKAPKVNKGGEKNKRGPARPYRKLDQGVLESRITKLQKRMNKAKAQVC